MTGTAHTIHRSHFGWNLAFEPAARVGARRGRRVPPDGCVGRCQLSAASTVADIARLDFERVNPVAGPIFVDGAQPGDARSR